MTSALKDLKVLELGSLIAGPFASRIFGDFGADIIKVEPPGKGDPIRKWRLLHEGTSLWWYVQSRNKKSIALDLREKEGQEAIRRLIKDTDILIENFRPGTLEKWNLGYEELKEINPGLIMVRISGYGQTGPYKDKPGFGSIGEAMGGIRHLTGYPDLPPTRVGISLGDSVSSLYAVIGSLIALRHRDFSGEGQIVDVALYESIFSLMESTVSEYDHFNHIRGRTGSTLPGIVPSNIYPCKDDKYIVIGANGDNIFKRLLHAIGKAEWEDDPRFSSNDQRVKYEEEIDNEIISWTKSKTISEVLEALDNHGVPAGKIYTAEDIVNDPHYLAREMIQNIEVENVGTLKMPGIVPKLSKTPGQINAPGPRLGEHTEEVLNSIGLNKIKK